MIKKFINDLADDKKDHVVLGQILASFITPFALFLAIVFYLHLTIKDLIELIFFGATFVFIIGTLLNIGKELVHDWYYEKGTPEWNDFIATEIPLLTSYLPYVIMLVISLI
jgi:hypothetical protein